MNKTPFVDPNMSGQEVWEEFSMSFTPAVKEVVEFAKRVPGFRDLSQHDQVNLLKAGTFEVNISFLFLLPSVKIDKMSAVTLVHLAYICCSYWGNVAKFASLCNYKLYFLLGNFILSPHSF